MDKKAVELARVDFDRAFQSITDLGHSEHFAEIERHWSAFLVSAARIYTRLEQGAKTPPKSYAWWSRKLHDRRNEPLLCYIWHARNADEHGLQKVTNKHPGEFKLVRPAGNLAYGEIQVVYPHIQLVEVVDRGKRYPVPHTHRGSEIHNPGPHNLGLFALMELEKMLVEAEQLVT